MTKPRAVPHAAWRETLYPAVRSMAGHLTAFAAGLVFSRGIVFSKCAPFGVAAIAAVPQKNMWAAVLGAVFGYLLPGAAWIPARYIAASLAAAAIRWTLSDLMKLRNHPVFAPVVSLLPILATGLAVVGVNGSSANTVVLTVAESILGGGSAYFMARAAALVERRLRGKETGGRERMLSSQDSACVVLTLGIALMALSGAQPGSFSVGHVLAVLGILFAAAYGGAAGGSIAGIASGVFFSLATSGLSYLSAGYAMGGLTAGLFASGGRLACAAAFILSNGIASLQMGNSSLALTGLYEVTAATVLFLILPERTGQAAVRLLRREEDPMRSESLRRSMVMRLDHAAKALGDVSRSVTEVSEKLSFTGAPDIEGVYRKASAEACRNCGMKIFCREKDGPGDSESLSPLTDILRKNGFVTKEDFPESFSAKCVRLDEMAAAVNRHYGEFALRETAERRADQIRELVAEQFTTVGSILESMAGELELYERMDTAAAGCVRDVLQDAGLLPSEVSCRVDRFGRMTVEAEITRGDRMRFHKGELVKRISRACGRSFAVPAVHPAGDTLRMVLTERPLYRAKIGVAQHVCGNGRLCGDSWEAFQDGGGRQLLIVSDGMGTGGRAAVDGTMASGILSKLMQAGVGVDASLKIVNAALMAKSGDESLATLDLCSVDLFTGEAEFCKAGAPISFIRKGEKAHTLEAPSLPAGILREVRFSRLNETLEDGDLAVLVSDGAVAGGSEWLLKELEAWRGDSPQQLAEELTEKAVKNRQDGRDDDITIAVLLLQEYRSRPVVA